MNIRLVLLSALLAAPAAAADTFTISTADCRALVAHTPRADVTYQGGVDVRGKPVVPADLNAGTSIDIPAFIEIPITVDVAKRLSAGAPGDILNSRRGLEGKAAIGMLTIKGNDAFWNGRPLQTQDELLMAEACRSSLHARGIVLPEAKPEAPK
jgi:hypothetical protein